MSDEELKTAISGDQPAEIPTNEEPASPPQEASSPSEPTEPEAPAEPAPADQEPVDAPAAPSRREQLRVSELLRKYGSPETPRPAAPSQTNAPDFSQVVDADPEVYEQLNKSANDYGQNQYQLGTNDALRQMRSVEWRTLLHLDAPQMESKYKVLDKTDKENFHPALSDALSRRYLHMVGYDPQTGSVANPDIRWRDFVESEFELAEEIAATRTVASTQNIAKQAAQTGLRPDGSGARGLDLNKHPEDMTDEELNAAVAASLPRDNRGRSSAKDKKIRKN
jgi:hypothetical protein